MTVSQNDIKYHIAERCNTRQDSGFGSSNFSVRKVVKAAPDLQLASSPGSTRDSQSSLANLFFDWPAVSSSLGELEPPLTKGGFAPSVLLIHFQELNATAMT